MRVAGEVPVAVTLGSCVAESASGNAVTGCRVRLGAAVTGRGVTVGGKVGGSVAGGETIGRGVWVGRMVAGVTGGGSSDGASVGRSSATKVVWQDAVDKSMIKLSNKKSKFTNLADRWSLMGKNLMSGITKSLNPFIFLIVTVLVITACSPAEEVVELPTLAVLPSVTPSYTPTATLTSTLTATPTNTLTATPTSTNTTTATPTSTLTSTPSQTPTPTSTLTVTSTPTNTLTPTPAAPQIITFGASATTVTGNSNITLSWNSISDTARIDQLNQQGAIVQTFSVIPVGQLNVLVPAGSRLVIYKLTAQRGGQEVTQSIPITVQCPISWFFGDQYAPANASCPTGVGAIGIGAFQSFERGFMIYVNANNLNRVYGMQTQDSRYIEYTSGWDGTTITPGSPPSGLLEPQQMFNWVYFNTNAPIGSWNGAIGWATSNIDSGNRTIQFEESTGAFYIDAPVGVFRFSGGSNPTWTRIK